MKFAFTKIKNDLETSHSGISTSYQQWNRVIKLTVNVLMKYWKQQASCGKSQQESLYVCQSAVQVASKGADALSEDNISHAALILR